MPTEAHDFENAVADLLRALGAQTRVNVNLGGQQIDLVAREFTDLGVEVVVAVECKYYQQLIGVDLVRAFAGVMEDLRRNKHADIGLMVTTRGYTQMARENAESNHIQLLEAADLEARPGLRLASVSEEVATAVGQSRVVQRLVHDALSSTEPQTSYDWHDLHANVEKAASRIHGLADLNRRSANSLTLQRRGQTAIANMAEDAARCMDAVWYLRQVIRLTDDADQLLAAGNDADRASAQLVRLRELDLARGQLRQRNRRLEETCERYS